MWCNKVRPYILGFLFLCAAPVFAQHEMPGVFLKSMRGDVHIRSIGDKDWAPAQVGMLLVQTTEVRVSSGGEAVIWLDAKEAAGKIAMAGRGVFRFAFIDRDGSRRKTVVELGSGTLMVQGDKDIKNSELEIRTPKGRVAVKDAAMKIRVE